MKTVYSWNEGDIEPVATPRLYLCSRTATNSNIRKNIVACFHCAGGLNCKSAKMFRSLCMSLSREKLCGLLLLATILTSVAAQNIGSSSSSSSTAPTLVHGGPSANTPTNCTAVRLLFVARGISSADIPNAPNNGECCENFLYPNEFTVSFRCLSGE